MSALTWQGEALHIQLFIQPKASRDEIVGLHGEELKVAITAPPVDGKANSHLIKFFSKEFRVAKGAITIVRGELGRHKSIVIEAPQKLPPVIVQLLDDAQ